MGIGCRILNGVMGYLLFNNRRPDPRQTTRNDFVTGKEREMITNPYTGEPDENLESVHDAWKEGERAGQSNAREAMRCETCEHLAEIPSGLYCKGKCATCIDYIDEPKNFGCIHHQPKTK